MLPVNLKFGSEVTFELLAKSRASTPDFFFFFFQASSFQLLKLENLLR